MTLFVLLCQEVTLSQTSAVPFFWKIFSKSLLDSLKSRMNVFSYPVSVCQVFRRGDEKTLSLWVKDFE